MAKLYPNGFIHNKSEQIGRVLGRITKVNGTVLKVVFFILLYGVQSSFSEIAAQRITLKKVGS